MSNSDPMSKKDHKARQSETEKFMTHRSWRICKAYLPGPREEVRHSVLRKQAEGPGAYPFITVQLVRMGRMLWGSGLGQISQSIQTITSKTWAFVSSMGPYLRHSQWRRSWEAVETITRGTGEVIAGAYSAGCCLRNEFQGATSVSSRPLQPLGNTKMDAEAAILYSSLAKFLTMSFLKGHTKYTTLFS